MPAGGVTKMLLPAGQACSAPWKTRTALACNLTYALRRPDLDMSSSATQGGNRLKLAALGCWGCWIPPLSSHRLYAALPKAARAYWRWTGKPRRSYDQAEQLSPLHLVSAWAEEQRLVLGQVAVADKSNEITALPRS